MSNIDNFSAHPCDKDCIDPGLTKREYAALLLRVPDSGDPEIDKMIRRARRMDIATMLYAYHSPNDSGWAWRSAEELLDEDAKSADALIAEEGK